jgi:hypothetical protein
VGRREASAQRSARAAPEKVRRLDTRLSAFRFLAFFRSYISWLEARIVRIPVSTAGVLWRRSVRRAEKFSSRDDDSGADRIARTVRLALVTRHPEVRAQRASKDAGRGAGGRRPSRLANFVGEHLRMTEELLRNVPEHEDGGALFDIVNRKEHVVGYGCFQYPAGPKILTPSRRSMARPKRYFISAPS